MRKITNSEIEETPMNDLCARIGYRREGYRLQLFWRKNFSPIPLGKSFATNFGRFRCLLLVIEPQLLELWSDLLRAVGIFTLHAEVVVLVLFFRRVEGLGDPDCGDDGLVKTGLSLFF